jgi:CRISPR-associated endoribonuclease Cas6
MRLQLSLVITDGHAIPLDYSRFVQAWIYKIISKSDKAYAKWLHDEGVKITHKNFKFFTFSQIQAKTKAHIDRKLLEIKSPKLQITLSFLLPEAMKNFVKGLFEEQTGFWGDRFNGIDFSVQTVDILPEPEFKTIMLYDCRQPVVVRYVNEEGKRKFAEPRHSEYTRQLCINAKSKYEAFYGETYTDALEFKILKVYKRKERRDQNNRVIVVGWTCEVEVKASVEMQKVIYFSGIGTANGYGCGFGNLKNKL